MIEIQNFFFIVHVVLFNFYDCVQLFNIKNKVSIIKKILILPFVNSMRTDRNKHVLECIFENLDTKKKKTQDA